MGASGAKYGIAAGHFYWIGTIGLLMLFLGLREPSVSADSDRHAGREHPVAR